MKEFKKYFENSLNEGSKVWDIDIYATIGLIEYHDVMSNMDYFITDDGQEDFIKDYKKDPYNAVKKFLKEYGGNAKDSYDVLKDNDALM